ncbi:MAG TPA: asparagine synthase (glutamine-hydrolyzing) [Alphaproteobacteria bacterium]
MLRALLASMCGVSGVAALHPGSAPVDRTELLAISEAMARRGPDGAGLWLAPDGSVGLAHRRLAIIDPLSRADQPMLLRDGALAIAFNGEITNYRALRAELAQAGRSFRTESDTEVLLHLYDREGAAMVERLRGMFAFAIWDQDRRRVFAARDPFGILPFYYAVQDGTLRFASQVRALRRSPAIPRGKDPAAQVGFLLLGYVPEPFTTDAAIRALPAGSTLSFDAGGLSIRSYCDLASVLREASTESASPADLRREDLREAMKGAVAQSLVADVPVAVFLSGGIDSAAIASCARAQNQPLTGVTVGFSEYRDGPLDETRAAAETARAYGMPHHVRWISAADFAAERENLLAAMDQPSIDGANSYFAAKAAKEAGFKVALSGIGGDEIFGGYPSFRQVPRLVKLLGTVPLLPSAGPALRALSAPVMRRMGKPKWAGLIEYGTAIADAYLLRRALFMPWELPGLLGPDLARAGWEALEPLLRMRELTRGMPSDASAITALELCWYMRGQLLKDADWAGLAHGVEIRPPLLDLPLLRHLAPLIASPAPPSKAELVGCLDPAPPEAVLRRPKMGFVVPWRAWIATGGSRQYPARIWARDVLHALAA